LAKRANQYLKSKSDFEGFQLPEVRKKKTEKICEFVYLIFKTCSQKING
jgi:hypothetical protein